MNTQTTTNEATTTTTDATTPQLTEKQIKAAAKAAAPLFKLPQSFGFKTEHTLQRIQDSSATFKALLSDEGKRHLARSTGEVVKTPLRKKLTDHTSAQRLAIGIAVAALNLEAATGVKLSQSLATPEATAELNKVMQDAYATHQGHLVEMSTTASNGGGTTQAFKYALKSSDYSKEVNVKHRIAQCALRLLSALTAK